MDELRQRFGNLLAAHRRHAGLTQNQLAGISGLSVDMISRLESGSTGARFNTIVKLSSALDIDPAGLFTDVIEIGATDRPKFKKLTSQLARLSDDELDWIEGLVTAALQSRPR
ncbi:helix-turn-helix domain-containing protein [Parasphingorhabdus sp. DH2-15]|uniref:helix-turn-helix domain-containing protein n=1 Tax=Parasphingorhabdus sp. DH2-15 TaxID=3444112 RepID=UPI003F6879B8